MATGEGNLSFPQHATRQVKIPNPTTEATQRQAGPNFFRDGENVDFMRAEAVAKHKYREHERILALGIETGLHVNRTAQTHDSVMHQFLYDHSVKGELRLELSFFTVDIFRVRFARHEDILQDTSNEPAFPPPEARMLTGKRQDVKVDFLADGNILRLSSDAVEISIQKQPFRMLAARKGQTAPFWRQRLSDLFTGDIVPTSIARHRGRTAMFEAFTLGPDEALFGLGERFDSVTRTGRLVDFVNHDAIGTSNTRSYINVPFFWSTAGYGCFVNSYARTEWDMGMSEAGTVGFSTEEECIDYFVVSGSTPKEILGRYTKDLTGTPVVPPTWSFGLWLSRNSYQSWEVVEKVLEEAKQHRIPVDDIHLDTAWFKEDWNPDLVFDKVRFGDHEAKMSALKKQGVHTSLWQYSFVPPREDNQLFCEGRARGFFGRAKNPDGSASDKLFEYPPDSDGWKLDDAVIDFSNPDARQWYGAKIASLIKQGASAIKTDFGDCVPPEAWYMNIDGRRFQNLFSLVYNATVTSAAKSVDKETAIWARSGTAGSQRYPLHWGGDSQCSWSALQGSLRATLSMGLSGFPFFSHDIGGFIGTPDAELYTRWAQVGLLGASHSRTHGAGDENAREPWAFGEEALAVFRKFTNLRYRLLPYIIEQSRQSASAGVPFIRHLVLDWSWDRNVWNIETQCLFGSHIMIAPVLQPAADMHERMSVYFPAGRWFNFWTHQLAVDSRGQWEDIPVPPLDSMAMWVLEGGMICFAEDGRQRTWNHAGEIVEVHIYGEAGQWRCGDGDGGEMAVKRIGDEWVAEGRHGVKVQKCSA